MNLAMNAFYRKLAFPGTLRQLKPRAQVIVQEYKRWWRFDETNTACRNVMPLTI
jgi:hypothetical protein